jgi:hypothetical protein
MIARRAHHDRMDSLVIRPAATADTAALQRLAALDSRRLPAGPHLLAEVDGRAVAALALRDDGVVADPFAYTATVVELLRRRAGQLRSTTGRSPNVEVGPRWASLSGFSIE